MSADDLPPQVSKPNVRFTSLWVLGLLIILAVLAAAWMTRERKDAPAERNTVTIQRSPTDMPT